ncbi:HK97 family phage prohead protease [Paraburkholderia sp.]|uniref:HK97 family phage prohead protease n=1 Tax=Paraburkholderia sp. TaxID=1926495 RepID=UPI0039E4A210
MSNETKGPRTADVVHATSLLMLREIDNEARIIEGVASTAAVDAYNDIVEPRGAEFRLPLPLLWHHNSHEPVGSVVFAKAELTGVRFRAQIAKITEPGKLRERCDEAWQSIKNSLIRAVSIGFVPLQTEPREGGGKRYTKWRWHELSLVTVPANADAEITGYRTLAEEMVERTLAEWRAAHPVMRSGPTRVVRLNDKWSAPRTGRD